MQNHLDSVKKSPLKRQRCLFGKPCGHFSRFPPAIVRNRLSSDILARSSPLGARAAEAAPWQDKSLSADQRTSLLEANGATGSDVNGLQARGRSGVTRGSGCSHRTLRISHCQDPCRARRLGNSGTASGDVHMLGHACLLGTDCMPYTDSM